MNKYELTFSNKSIAKNKNSSQGIKQKAINKQAILNFNSFI